MKRLPRTSSHTAINWKPNAINWNYVCLHQLITGFVCLMFTNKIDYFHRSDFVSRVFFHVALFPLDKSICVWISECVCLFCTQRANFVGHDNVQKKVSVCLDGARVCVRCVQGECHLQKLIESLTNRIFHSLSLSLLLSASLYLFLKHYCIIIFDHFPSIPTVLTIRQHFFLAIHSIEFKTRNSSE